MTGAAVPTQADIEAAAVRLGGLVRRTPVLDWRLTLPDGRTITVTLKLELFQHAGSFKPRGAFNCVLGAGWSPGLLVTASGGNHGMAVAHVARTLGLGAEVYVPAAAPLIKVDRIRALGAEVVLGGESYHEAAAASRKRAGSDILYVHAYDHPHVLEGQGTVGLELQQQAPDLDTILVATGGGGLIGGIAASYAGAAGVVSVEPIGARAMHAALAAGEPVDVPVGGLAADALGATRVGDHGFASASTFAVHAVLVEPSDIARARDLLWTDLRIAAEPGGATALAALLSGSYVPGETERVGVVVCGANADPGDLPN